MGTPKNRGPSKMPAPATPPEDLGQVRRRRASISVKIRRLRREIDTLEAAAVKFAGEFQELQVARRRNENWYKTSLGFLMAVVVLVSAVPTLTQYFSLNDKLDAVQDLTTENETQMSASKAELDKAKDSFDAIRDTVLQSKADAKTFDDKLKLVDDKLKLFDDKLVIFNSQFAESQERRKAFEARVDGAERSLIALGERAAANSAQVEQQLRLALANLEGRLKAAEKGVGDVESRSREIADSYGKVKSQAEAAANAVRVNTDNMVRVTYVNFALLLDVHGTEMAGRYMNGKGSWNPSTRAEARNALQQCVGARFSCAALLISLDEGADNEFVRDAVNSVTQVVRELKRGELANMDAAMTRAAVHAPATMPAIGRPPEASGPFKLAWASDVLPNRKPLPDTFDQLADCAIGHPSEEVKRAGRELAVALSRIRTGR